MAFASILRSAAFTLVIVAGLLCLPSGRAAAQFWRTPESYSYPSGIIDFAGTRGTYGYNEEGDLYTAEYWDEVYQHDWVLKMRGELSGLNHVDHALCVAVGNGGAVWRTDFSAPGFFIPVEPVTDADLYFVRGWGYEVVDQYYMVGDRGTLLEYVASTCESRVLTQGVYPTLRAIEWAPDWGMVAVGDSGCILRSNDHWKSRNRLDRNGNHSYSGIAIPDCHVVLFTGHDAGTGDAVIVRTDRAFKDWSEYHFSGHYSVRGVRFTERAWFAFGDNGLLATSTDSARSWLPVMHGTRFDFTDVVASWRHITAVGKSAVDGHFRSIISSDTGKTWNVWIEAEDSLGALHVSPATSWDAPIATEKGYVFRSTSSSVKYPFKTVLSVPAKLTAYVYLAYHGIVLGGADGRIFRSTDNGDSWSSSEALSGDVISLDLLRKTRVMALTVDGRIYSSDDTGATWSHVCTVPAGRSFSRLQCENGDTCLAVGADAGNGAAWISVDGGASWRNVLVYGDELTGIDIDSAGTMYICTASARLLRSMDNGSTWTTLLHREGRRFADVSVGASTHVALIENRDNVLLSSDAGISWREFQPKGQTFDHIEVKHSSWIAWGGAQTLFKGLGRSNLDDRLGSGRERIFAAVADSTQRAICVGENGMILLGNQRILGPVSVDLHDVGRHLSRLIAVGDSGIILRTSWPMISWAPVHRDSAGRSLRQVECFPSGTSVAAGPRVLFRSMQDGSEWIEQKAFPGGRIAGAPPSTLYSFRDDGAVFFSEDAGSTWELRATLSFPVRDCGAFDTERILALCLDSSSGIPWSYVFRSTDFGHSWEAVFRMPGRFTVLRLFGQARVLLSGEEGTVFFSYDAGSTWAKTRSRFRTLFNDVLCLDPNRSVNIEYLFVASPKEIDRLALPATVLDQRVPPGDADKVSIDCVFPNPCSTVLQVGILGRPRGTHRLALHDLLGRQVLMQEHEAGISDSLQTTLDVSRCARGMYILRLTGEGVNDVRLVCLR